MGMCDLILSTFVWDISHSEKRGRDMVNIFFFLPMPPHVLMNFRGFPPGCGDSVADFWGWNAHEARLRCPDDVSGDMQEDGIPGGGLKPKSANYPDHSHHGESFPARKNSHGRSGNRTRDPMISNQTPWPLDHQAGPGVKKLEPSIFISLQIFVTCITFT